MTIRRRVREPIFGNETYIGHADSANMTTKEDLLENALAFETQKHKNSRRLKLEPTEAFTPYKCQFVLVPGGHAVGRDTNSLGR